MSGAPPARRLTVWEDAVDQGLVERRRESGATIIALTLAGRRTLAGS